MSIIISADEIKKRLPDYSPDKAEQFHRESTRQADSVFERELKQGTLKEVILLCGGAASGKTEFLETHLSSKECIIFDATLSTEETAKNKISKTRKSKKKLTIYAIIPDDLKRAFLAFLNRDRKFSDTYFYKTHSGSRSTLLFIAKNHPEVELNIIESSYTKDQKLQFARYSFKDKQQLIDFITSFQLTEAGIISQLEHKL